MQVNVQLSCVETASASLKYSFHSKRNADLLIVFVLRQQALLAAISEKDANIALLELSASNKKKTQDEVISLKRERDKLMHQLKQHVSTAGPCQGFTFF